MESGPLDNSNAKKPSGAVNSGEISSPSREQALIESLVESKLSWSTECHEEDHRWHSSETDPFLPPPDPGCDVGYGKSYRPGFGQPMSPFRIVAQSGMNWHKIRTEILRSSSDEYDIVLIKTHVNWYRHNLRKEKDTVSYEARFTDREDPTRTFRISDQAGSRLAQIIKDISRAIQ